jgi:hypothetical protein
MKKTLVKRRMGRPPTGVRPFLGARFAKEEADGIDRFAKAIDGHLFGCPARTGVNDHGN